MSSSSSRSNRRPPPAIGKARLADSNDVTFIFDLCTDAMKKTFRIKGPSQIANLIQISVLSVVQLDVKDDIIGFFAAREYPLIPSVHPFAWEEYVWTKYKAIELKARNTLFLHLICWKTLYSRELVDKMLSTLFMHDPYVHYVCMIKSVIGCPQLVPGSSRVEGSFRRVQAMERGLPGDKLPALMIADRKEICPRLRVRRAVYVVLSFINYKQTRYREEDNDDIVPIIERHSVRLRELYGDFYISELVSRHPESERVLVVCEHKEVAVGVMCLNTQINFESLEECYELSPYAGLRHLDQAPPGKKDPDTNSLAEVESTQSSLCGLDNFANALYYNKNKPVEEFPAEENETPEIYAPRGDQILGRLSLSALIDLFEGEEEEEVEFEITNIEPDLLKVPNLIYRGESIARNLVDGVSEKPPETVPMPATKKKSIASSVASLKPPEYIIRYKGTSNAFLLELFAMHPDYDERYGLDMLEATYELFPNRDYCIVCLPSNHTSYSLLEHFTLVTPHSTRMRFINESLYVAHINSVRGDVSVRRAEHYDKDSLLNILEHAPRQEVLTELFETSLTSRSINSYLLLAQNQPIGVIVIGPLEDGASIRTRYALEAEPPRPGTDGAILCGVMSPALEPHGRWYLRDILRQSKYATLFWLCQSYAKGEQCPQRNMMSLAERMVPVRPRRSLHNITGDSNLDRLFQDFATPFALWMIERPLSALPKVYSNNNIVVVGASRTGLAFLETLIMGQTARYLTFTNLTLVSEHGLPTVADCLKAADTCIPQQGRYNNHYMMSMPFTFYLDIIPAVMVSIDRKKKCIHLKNGGTKFYDNLVLTCGLQFQHPEYLEESLERAKEVKKGKPCIRMLMDSPKYQPDRLPLPSELPVNVFLINSVYQANIALRKLLRMMAEQKDVLSEDNRIVVYGDCLESYSCMAALCELGVAGYHIAFVENFPPEDTTALRVNCFNDETVDERVQISLESVGIKILRKCRLVKWHTFRNNVVSIKLMSPLHCYKLKCFALFYYGLKSIDIHAFKAVNECGLVYDGGLVIGPMFETNDPDIYAAGTCINYSRRLYAGNYLHRYYNSEDVGEALAQYVLRKLDPFISCHSDFSIADLLPSARESIFTVPHPSIAEVRASRHMLVLPAARRWQTVMKFESPIVKSATFPGPLYYLKVLKPGPESPMEIQKTLPRTGHLLKTDKDGNYFCLQLNILHCVESVTCLSKKPFPTEILSQLYGKHEAFFNKLLLRHQLGQIDDFFSFFVQPWMATMYQESFEDLLYNIDQQTVNDEYESLKSKFASFSDAHDAKHGEENPAPESQSTLTESTKSSTAASPLISEVVHVKAPKKIWTLRAVIDKYVKKLAAHVERTQGIKDIPSECGQCATMRNDVAGFWEAIGADQFVFAQIGAHITRHNVTNPHIATCMRDPASL